MAERPVDISIRRFWQATGAVLGALVVLHLIIWGLDGEGPNVGFVLSVAISLLLTMPILHLMKTRPVGRYLTWGEAMVASTYVFLLLFWIYGVVPHQWLTWADSELNWRADRLVVGPELPFTSGDGIVEWLLPFDMTYQVLRDIVVVIIYGIALVANVALWHMWQARGREPKTEIETSRYGRPLVREASS